ncbi:hypothetical protein Ae201684P_021843 [Aphanomyces euteiches]|uniref:EamA domain-containing protein n=1 Tax=Aphanomyces euteiches TaxID=100861 RepID=A0A6G0WSK0_9STRA|nr:hypothetical protein Ae201684_012100 [Aphanomyces euteiches]KAF0730399.1 hypothetical protein Ae201684_012101 [Aphanomyces euteiches]KAH9056035.1 hypothetical protein Ae201684P_021774 [Aphanomyces euteiches]KAH9056105.1 hypothetical protein Ae201684P_021843 [Aphanomyces euteiches]KAH9147155.1 hypothetical protein AeRB84_009169 [Aphanomyces euteiches]
MSANVGVLLACIAFVTYGLYPIYFKQLPDVPPLQMACHRVVWSFALLVPLFLWQVEWKTFRDAALKPKVLATYFVSGAAIGSMWYLFLWGVSKDYIIETSLGFFINPVLSVLLAVVVLKERLRVWQWVSIALAMVGVLVIAIAYGKFPWLAITLGVLLATYGFVKSTAPLNAVEGVTMELGFLFLPAVCILIVCEVQGSGAFGHISATQNAMLVLCGVVTVIPLLLFAHAAHLISFSLLGLLQYIGPIMTFVIGVVIYHESFATPKLIGFIIVWIGLLVYIIESFVFQRMAASAVDDADIQKTVSVPGTPSSDFEAVMDDVDNAV